MLQPNFHLFPVISTSRLLLRAIADMDRYKLFALRSDTEVMRFIEHRRARSMADIDVFIRAIQVQHQNSEGVHWAITMEGTDELIGNIALFRIQKEHYRAELGYSLATAFQGKGIMTEAVSAVLAYGFNTLGLHSVEAHINPENTASKNVLERAGFVREGLFKENFYSNGTFTDTAVYSLLKS